MPQILDHLYRMFTIERSGSRETNSLFSLINQQHDIDKTYLYAKAFMKQNTNAKLTNKKVQGFKSLEKFK